LFLYISIENFNFKNTVMKKKPFDRVKRDGKVHSLEVELNEEKYEFMPMYLNDIFYYVRNEKIESMIISQNENDEWKADKEIDALKLKRIGNKIVDKMNEDNL